MGENPGASDGRLIAPAEVEEKGPEGVEEPEDPEVAEGEPEEEVDGHEDEEVEPLKRTPSPTMPTAA